MQFQYQKVQVMRPVRLLLLALLLVPLALQAQDNPAPLPPNYELIKKETGRWFGEYRYSRLVTMFWNCDTNLTIDHFRCLYYGAALRGDTTYTLTNLRRRRDLTFRLYGDSSIEREEAWYQYVMMISAVWSSGNGSDTLPFHVASYADARLMRDDTGDSAVCCSLMGRPLRRKAVQPVQRLDGENRLRQYDSLAMFRMGVLPDARQVRLWRDISEAYGTHEDSLMTLLLSTYATEEQRLWAELQVAAFHKWGRDKLRLALDRHLSDTSALVADLYHRMAAHYYRQATEYSCNSCFAEVLAYCDTAEARWPQSDGAAKCRLLREQTRLPEAVLYDEHRETTRFRPASEWSIATVWHRNTQRVWLRVYAAEDTLFSKVLYQWQMPVTDHGDLCYHEAYLYLPPMQDGHYLLRASADSLFSTWSTIELFRSDLYLMSDSEGEGHGVVLNAISGKPVPGFKVSMMARDSVVATTTTDSMGYFRFNGPAGERCTLRAMYKGVDIAHDGYCYIDIQEIDTINAIDVENPDHYYRAGDTLRFRCVSLTADGIVANLRQVIRLSELWEMRDSLTVISDSHGVSYGYFVVPADCHDDMEISADHYYSNVGPPNIRGAGGDDVDSALEAENPADSENFIAQSTPYIYESMTQSWDTLRFFYGIGRWRNGNIPQPVDAGLRLARLKPTKTFLLNPAELSPSAEHSIDEAEYRRRYPWFAYDRSLNNANLWEVDSIVFVDRRTFPAQAHRGFAMPPLAEGVYRASLVAYEGDSVTCSDSLILFSGALPMVAAPVDAWLDTSALGDTLYIHVATRLPDQWAVVTVQYNRDEYVWLLHLSQEERLLSLPLNNEGKVVVNVNNVFHGEPTVILLQHYVGLLGQVLLSHWDMKFCVGLDGKMQACEFWVPHTEHRPALRYPERQRPLPNVWQWLGIKPARTIEIYDPLQYAPWRNYASMLRLPR